MMDSMEKYFTLSFIALLQRVNLKKSMDEQLCIENFYNCLCDDNRSHLSERISAHEMHTFMARRCSNCSVCLCLHSTLTLTHPYDKYDTLNLMITHLKRTNDATNVVYPGTRYSVSLIGFK